MFALLFLLFAPAAEVIDWTAIHKHAHASKSVRLTVAVNADGDCAKPVVLMLGAGRFRTEVGTFNFAKGKRAGEFTFDLGPLLRKHFRKGPPRKVRFWAKVDGVKVRVKSFKVRRVE